ncbi:MAG: DUF2808 domain-containing protein [Geitlerinemataceae cyanobacterium]
MKLRGWAIIALAVVLEATLAPVIEAVQLRDGKIHFDYPPSFLGATTPDKSAGFWNATYYFTLELPENAGEPLQQVTIAQTEGLERLRFDPEKTVIFEGNPRNKGEEITEFTAEFERETRTVSVIFDPPISPEKILTIGLKAARNPLGGGIYLFGVTVFPAGEEVQEQYLGFGRLRFYDDRDDSN